MLPRTMSVKQAAEYLKVQPRTVRIWIARGKLPASRTGKSYIIPEPEVEKMVTPTKTEQQNLFTQMSRAERLEHIRTAMRGVDISPELVMAEREERRLKRQSFLERGESCR